MRARSERGIRGVAEFVGEVSERDMCLPLLRGLEDIGRDICQARGATIVSIDKRLTSLGIPFMKIVSTTVFINFLSITTTGCIKCPKKENKNTSLSDNAENEKVPKGQQEDVVME